MRKLPLLGSTKDRILRQLLEQDRTAVEIAASLRIQVSAARKHLEKLRANGIVDMRFVRRGPGRPKKVYFLTEDGKELFPRQYDAVLNAVLATLAKEQGDAYVESVMRRVGEEIASSINPQPGRSPAQIAHLARALDDLGFDPSVEERRGVYTITSLNCPVLRAAVAHRELVCRGLHAEIIRASTGAPDIQRDKWIVEGDGRCTHLFPKRARKATGR